MADMKHSLLESDRRRTLYHPESRTWIEENTSHGSCSGCIQTQPRRVALQPRQLQCQLVNIQIQYQALFADISVSDIGSVVQRSADLFESSILSDETSVRVVSDGKGGASINHTD